MTQGVTILENTEPYHTGTKLCHFSKYYLVFVFNSYDDYYYSCVYTYTEINKVLFLSIILRAEERKLITGLLMNYSKSTKICWTLLTTEKMWILLM
jgi:hypothetical protein